MTIELNGKTYRVIENKTTWRVTREQGALSVTFSLPKGYAEDLEALKAYMAEHADMF